MLEATTEVTTNLAEGTDEWKSKEKEMKTKESLYHIDQVARLCPKETSWNKQIRGNSIYGYIQV